MGRNDEEDDGFDDGRYDGMEAQELELRPDIAQPSFNGARPIREFSQQELQILHMIADPRDKRPIEKKAKIAGLPMTHVRQLYHDEAFVSAIEVKSRLLSARDAPMISSAIAKAVMKGSVQGITQWMAWASSGGSSGGGGQGGAKAPVELSLKIVGLDVDKIAKLTGQEVVVQSERGGNGSG